MLGLFNHAVFEAKRGEARKRQRHTGVLCNRTEVVDSRQVNGSGYGYGNRRKGWLGQCCASSLRALLCQNIRLSYTDVIDFE